MSNILIIKHGSLGDIAQASGAIQDIYENHQNENIYLLTTKTYIDLFKKNPYLKDVILDKRYSRFNIFYLYFLMKNIKKLKIKFMIYKILQEPHFIKESYFLMLVKKFGPVHLRLCRKIRIKMNLTNYQY